MGMSRGYMHLALRGLETELREMADRDGIVMLSNRSIASKLNIGQRQINEMITELVDEGLVHKTRGLLRVNGSVKESNGSVKESNGSVTDARHDKTLKTLEDHESLTILKREDKNTHEHPVKKAPTKPKRVAADDPGFKAFWETYPRKVGKLPAAKWWESRWPNDQELMSILEGLDAWVEDWQARGTEIQYIPHPVTWLRAERWTEPPEAQK